MTPHWVQRADGSWAWAGYQITAHTTAHGIGWVISRNGRRASALICRHLRGAMSLAEWDAATLTQYARR